MTLSTHPRSKLRDHILRSLDLTNDPEIRLKLQQQLFDLIGPRKAAKSIKPKADKGVPVVSGEGVGGLLGI